MPTKLTAQELEEYGKLRKYKNGSLEAYSVTSIINYVFGVPDYLVKWSVKVAAIRMWDEVKNSPKTPSKKMLLELAEHERIFLLKQSGIKGTAVHNGIDGFIETNEHPEIDDSFKGYYSAAIDFLTDNKIKPLLREEVVFNKEHSYAGRFDLYCEMWGKRVLIDFKTSNHLSFNYGLQLAAYKKCLEDLGYKVERTYILHLKENGDYNIISYDEQFSAFIDVLKVFNRKVALERPEFNWASDALALEKENGKN